MDMLTRFFINKDRSVSSRGRSMYRSQSSDGGAIKWRLKGHAEEPFWRWVSTWARAIRKPSDYGFDDGSFVLPDLVERTTVVSPRMARDDAMLELPARGLREEREENRRTLDERCEAAADALADADHAVAWCHLNDESKRLTQLIDGASYEQMYQSIRRMWRFGQAHPVEVDFVTSPGGRDVVANLHRKAEAADRMFTALVEHMNDARGIDSRTYDQKMELPTWLAS